MVVPKVGVMGTARLGIDNQDVSNYHYVHRRHPLACVRLHHIKDHTYPVLVRGKPGELEPPPDLLHPPGMMTVLIVMLMMTMLMMLMLMTMLIVMTGDEW